MHILIVLQSLEIVTYLVSNEEVEFLLLERQSVKLYCVTVTLVPLEGPLLGVPLI